MTAFNQAVRAATTKQRRAARIRIPIYQPYSEAKKDIISKKRLQTGFEPCSTRF